MTGASGGIGAAVARSLHEAGASVGLLSRRGEDLGLERALGIACDVRDRDAVGRATEQVVERFGRLDIAVANAGVGSYGPFLELDPDDLEAILVLTGVTTREEAERHPFRPSRIVESVADLVEELG